MAATNGNNKVSEEDAAVTFNPESDSGSPKKSIMKKLSQDESTNESRPRDKRVSILRRMHSSSHSGSSYSDSFDGDTGRHWDLDIYLHIKQNMLMFVS